MSVAVAERRQLPGHAWSALKMVAGLRLTLAVLALSITYIDPTEPNQFREATYAVLVAYVVFSAVIYAACRDWLPLLGRLGQRFYWADVVFYAALIALSGGGNSIFFVLFFFAILAAAFRDGFVAGVKVTATCCGLFVFISLAQQPLDPDFDLNRFLLRTSALPIIGYLICFWGGREVRQVRELAFLNEIGHLANPRLDIDRILALAMERLREFFAADSCLVITTEDTGKPAILRRISPEGTPGSPPTAEPVPEAIATTLLGLDPDRPVVHGKESLVALGLGLMPIGRRRRSDERVAGESARSRAAAALLEAESFISVPLRLAQSGKGFLYLIRGKRGFTSQDAEFLSLAVDQFTPTLQYVALVDRMAAQVIEDERRRIALDIHDHVIQPYIGLQLGLTALTQRLENHAGDESHAAALAIARKLMTLTDDGIADLRGYVGRLKSNPAGTTATASTLALFTARYAQATGIDVELHLAEELATNNVAAETAFPIVAEALSNIRRHTLAERAVVDLRIDGGWLRIKVENPVDPGIKPGPFTPKSIEERVAAIGGMLRVDHHDRGMTRLIVDLPL